MSTSNELFQLLYGILDKLERIENHLGIQETDIEQEKTPKFSVVKDETVVKFPTLE